MANIRTMPVGRGLHREHFFGTDPELLKMVEHLSDEDIMALNRGGHDPYKVYAAYAEAVKANGKPTVILAKTVKGYAFGGGRKPECNALGEEAGYRGAEEIPGSFWHPNR